MNPYVSFGLVMCLVVVLSIAATAYLAVFFNRRAKADLQAALAPLAEVVNGEVELEAAEVSGKFAGRQVKARMANASEGPGRVWQIDALDAAGGVGWIYTSSLPKSTGSQPRIEFESVEQQMRHQIDSLQADRVIGIADPAHERFRLEYNPESGFVRFIVPMQNRRDIPDAERFTKQLGYMVRLGYENRTVQERLLSTGSESEK